MSKLGGHPVELSKLGGHPVELSKLGGHPVELSKLGGHPVELSKLGGHQKTVTVYNRGVGKQLHSTNQAVDLHFNFEELATEERLPFLDDEAVFKIYVHEGFTTSTHFGIACIRVLFSPYERVLFL